MPVQQEKQNVIALYQNFKFDSIKSEILLWAREICDYITRKYLLSQR